MRCSKPVMLAIHDGRRQDRHCTGARELCVRKLTACSRYRDSKEKESSGIVRGFCFCVAADTTAKRLGLLREPIPRLRRLAILVKGTVRGPREKHLCKASMAGTLYAFSLPTKAEKVPAGTDRMRSSTTGTG
jgi:hypothetical protein